MKRIARTIVWTICGALSVSAGEFCNTAGGALLPLYWSDGSFSARNPVSAALLRPGECAALDDGGESRLTAYLKESGEIAGEASLYRGLRCGDLALGSSSRLSVPGGAWETLIRLWAGEDASLERDLRYVWEEFSDDRRASGADSSVELSEGAALLEREVERLSGKSPDAAVFASWLRSLDETAAVPDCAAADSLPKVLEWSKSLSGQAGTVTLRLEGYDPVRYSVSRAASGAEFAAELSGTGKLAARLRMPLDWRPLPRYAGGRWLDRDGNGRPDGAELVWTGASADEEPPTVLFRKRLPSGGETAWAERRAAAPSGEGLWKMEFDLPDWETPLTVWPLPLEWNTVRAEVRWSDAATEVNLADGVGPMLGSARTTSGGVLLSFTEPVVGLSAGDLLFGVEERSHPDAELERLAGDRWLLRLSESLPSGIPVRVSPSSAAVDRYGNRVPIAAPSVALTTDPALLASRPTRLECEHLANLRVEPAVSAFGEPSLGLGREGASVEFDPGDSRLEFLARIPLTSAFAEARRREPAFRWSLRIYSGLGTEVASISGKADCSVALPGCAPSSGDELRLSIPWNLRDAAGRTVGSEAFVVRFDMMNDGKWMDEPLQCRVGVFRNDGTENLAR